jgi:hypothetical protein
MPLEEKFLNHKSNIQQKVRVATGANLVLAKEVQARYDEYVASLVFPGSQAEVPVVAVRCLNDYVDYVKAIESKHTFFNWRSNFAGSVIPEFFYRYLVARFDALGIQAMYSTKESVVEATFSISEAGGIDLRRKDQDLCVGVRLQRLSPDGNEVPFLAPAACCEVKTNIDINKLNGLDFSAERLKRSFPGASYFLITETIDFSLNDNYSAGYIDEIFVLRKQVRSVARKTKEPLQADVIKAAGDAFVNVIHLASRTSGHVYERLTSGRLIRP